MAAHGHVEADVTGLPADLSGKAAASHSHAESDVTSLAADLAAKVSPPASVSGTWLWDAAAGAWAVYWPLVHKWVTADAIHTQSSTTMENLTDLALPVEANARYHLDGWIRYAASPTADANFRFAVPSGASGNWSLFGVTTAATTSTVGSIAAGSGSIATTPIAVGGVGSGAPWTSVTARPTGYLVTSSTAGTLQMQFAQANSDATDLTVFAGSWLRATRVA